MNDPVYLNLYFGGLLLGLLWMVVYVSRQGGALRRHFYLHAFVFVLLPLLYFGLRPLDFGTDTETYISGFQMQKFEIKNNLPVDSGKDLGFGYFVRICACFLSERGFLLACSTLLMVPLFAAYKRLFGSGALLPFFMLCCCFFFLQYGVNIMRAGIAYSFFLLCISSKSRWEKLVWVALAVGFHASVLLPVAVWFMLSVMKKWKTVYSLIIWLACLALVIYDINFFTGLLGVLNLGALTDRAMSYAVATWIEYNTGFRTDFVLFSTLPIAMGLWFEKKSYGDAFSSRILNAYIILNAIFLLTMGIPYSDRYAVLSWSLIPIIYSYPAINHPSRRNRLIWLALLSMIIIISYIITVN